MPRAKINTTMNNTTTADKMMNTKAAKLETVDVDAVITSLREEESASEREAARRFDALVQSLASGKAPPTTDIQAVLIEAKKTADTLDALVKAEQRRRRLAEHARDVPTHEARFKDASHAVRDVEREKQEAVKDFDRRIAELKKTKDRVWHGLHLASEAQRSLFDMIDRSAIEAETKAGYRARRTQQSVIEARRDVQAQRQRVEVLRARGCDVDGLMPEQERLAEQEERLDAIEREAIQATAEHEEAQRVLDAARARLMGKE